MRTRRVKGAQTGLVAVSCTSASFCVAVGRRVVPTPGALGGRYGGLDNVSCPTTTFCALTGKDTAGEAAVARPECPVHR